MAVAYRITPELRVKLKEPYGVLIKGSVAQTMSKIKEIVKNQKPSMIISVGDTVSSNLYENKIYPQVAIIDNKCMRKDFSGANLAGRKVHAKNPQGTITSEAVAAVKDALKGKERTVVVVDGEEDLLTLIAAQFAPEGSVVVYGQPYEGIVIVEVTPQKKAETSQVLKAMEIPAKS